jgi:hypothetical protein
MRELGRAGGKTRRAGVAEKLPEAERLGLRDVLREQLDHEKVKAAIERSLAGGNESARVAAVKFLADLELYRADGEDERERTKAAGAEARGKLADLIRRRAGALHRAGKSKLAEEFRAAAAELWPPGEPLPSGVVVGDVSAEEAGAVLEGLVAVGLIRHPLHAADLDAASDAGIEKRAGERAERLAQS